MTITMNSLSRWEVPSVCTMVVPRYDNTRSLTELIEDYISNFGKWFDHAIWLQCVPDEWENSEIVNKFYSEILGSESRVMEGHTIHYLSPPHLYKNLDKWMASEASAEYFDNYLFLNGKIEKTGRVIEYSMPVDSFNMYVIGTDSHKGTNSLGVGLGSYDYYDSAQNDLWDENYAYEEDEIYEGEDW